MCIRLQLRDDNRVSSLMCSILLVHNSDPNGCPCRRVEVASAYCAGYQQGLEERIEVWGAYKGLSPLCVILRGLRPSRLGMYAVM